MSSSENNHRFMQRALELAEQRRGFCAPNPAVGAVVVKDGKVIGEGAHWACGHPHAEVMALQSLDKAAAGAALYVTLEPCSHFGKTPPCTDLIIHSGIGEVFFGMRDPNPQVSGQGADILERAGIPCRLVPSAAVEDFYQSYRYWLAKRLPWVTLKLALSLDGKIAGAGGAPVQLTGAECHRLTHQQRRRSDAILTTAATILADDPQLNARIDGEVIAKPLYILDSQLRLPTDAQVLRTAKSVTIFHSAAAPENKRVSLERLHATCVPVESSDTGLSLPAVLAAIGADGRQDLWVEAGGHCFQSFLSQALAQRVYIYVAPKILGPFSWSADPAQLTWRIYGADAVAQVDLEQNR